MAVTFGHNLYICSSYLVNGKVGSSFQIFNLFKLGRLVWQVIQVVAVDEHFVINFHYQPLVVDDEVRVESFSGNLRQVVSV